MNSSTSKVSALHKKFILSHAHHIMLAVILMFVAAAVLLGETLNMYDTLWWWDDMLHGLSGLIFGLVGLFIMFALNNRTDIRVNAAFVAVFVICFALAMGVLWEIYEFGLDVFFQTSMQQWNMGSNAIVMGRDYQGMGLRDTMSDLILATIGALIAGAVSYIVYGHKRSAVRHVMRKSFPRIK